jgi:Ca2+-binding EF-hand superfamily protein
MHITHTRTQGPRTVGLLLKRFAARDARHDPKRFVNYRQFCQCVDDSEVVTRSNTLSSPLASAARSTLIPRKELAGSCRSLREIFAMIKQKCKQNRVRLDEYFRDYDKLRKGVITQSQLGRGLAQGQFGLSDQEVKTIVLEYQSEFERDTFGEPFVKWKKFVEVVDQVFTIKNIDKDPTVDVTDAVRRAEEDDDLNNGRVEIDDTDREALFQAMQVIATKVRQRRVELIPSFKDFDRKNSGYVPASRFMRVLSGLTLLPARETNQELIKAYFMETQATGMALGREDVNYKAFVAALDTIADGATSLDGVQGAAALRKDRKAASATSNLALMNTSNLARKPDNSISLETTGYSIDDVMRDVKSEVSVKRIRVTEILQDADRLRRGEVSSAQFESALSRAGIQLEAYEINAIEKEFRADKNADMINWKKFANTLEGTPNLEKSPTKVPQSGYFGAGAAGVAETNGADLDECLSRIKDFTNIRRLHMKPYFHDYDKSRRFRVTASQFSSVMDMMKVPLTQKDRTLLTDKFTIVEGRKKTNFVNYKAFVMAVDETETS